MSVPHRLAALAVPLVAAAIATSACSAAPPETQPHNKTSSPTSSAPATPDTSQADQQVCGDLEHMGHGFYNDVYVPMLSQSGDYSSIDIDPTTLIADTAALSTIGAGVADPSNANSGNIDGSATIGRAQENIRTAAIKMVGDAKRTSQHFTDEEIAGQSTNNTVTEVLTSFGDVTVACSEDGYQPSWFKPGEIIGNGS